MNIKKLFNKIFPKKFHNFYKKIRNNKNLETELVQISDNFINSKSYKLVSNQWHILNIIDYKNILKSGFENLGVNTFNHYFNFFDYENEYLRNL